MNMKKAYFFIILLAVYSLLWATGGLAHELLGVVFAGLLIIHMIINRRWFTALFRGIYSDKRKLMLVSNLLLLVAIILTLTTGVMYSRKLFSDLPIHQGARSFKKIHAFFAYITLVFLVTHTYLHKQVVIKYVNLLVNKVRAKSAE